MSDPLHILQVNAFDSYGGAEQVARNLQQEYQRLGHSSHLVVGHQKINCPDTLWFNNDSHRGLLARLGVQAGALLTPFVGKIRGVGYARSTIQLLGQPRRLLRTWQGVEDFDFPATHQLLNLVPGRPDIIHCHNLHGKYFDLRALPRLSQQAPLLLTLHDAWLLSGHCAHSFGCERWQTGCGHCPDLTIYPAIHHDATAYNWQRKQEIYGQCRLYVATPSQWLMNKVTRSMLAPAILEGRVIPNGVDRSIFQPADKNAVRANLGLAPDSHIILFAASGIRKNIWKDYQTMRAAVSMVANNLPEQCVTFIALGDDSPPEQVGAAQVRYIPFQDNPETVASYYQAADVYLHAAKVDTFPNTVLEALACATPVIATAVGGIPEQVKGLHTENFAWQIDGQPLNQHNPAEATGVLTLPGDVSGLTNAIVHLLIQPDLRRQLSHNAVTDARQRFGLTLQADRYLQWYRDIAAKWVPNN